MGHLKDWFAGIISDEQDREDNDEGHVLYQSYPKDRQRALAGNFHSVNVTSVWHPLRPCFSIGAELIKRGEFVVYLSLGIYTIAIDRTYQR